MELNELLLRLSALTAYMVVTGVSHAIAVLAKKPKQVSVYGILRWVFGVLSGWQVYKIVELITT